MAPAPLACTICGACEHHVQRESQTGWSRAICVVHPSADANCSVIQPGLAPCAAQLPLKPNCTACSVHSRLVPDWLEQPWDQLCCGREKGKQSMSQTEPADQAHAVIRPRDSTGGHIFDTPISSLVCGHLKKFWIFLTCPVQWRKKLISRSKKIYTYKRDRQQLFFFYVSAGPSHQVM